MKLTFWAQGLGESDPTVVVNCGERVSDTSQQEIDDVIEWLRKIREEGHLVGERRSASGWLSGHRFLIRVILAERDFKGREAPVLIGGSIVQRPVSQWWVEAAQTAEHLLNGFGFSISVTAREELQEIFYAIQKKTLKKRRLHTASVFFLIGCVVLFILRCGITKK